MDISSRSLSALFICSMVISLKPRSYRRLSKFLRNWTCPSLTAARRPAVRRCSARSSSQSSSTSITKRLIRPNACKLDWWAIRLHLDRSRSSRWSNWVPAKWHCRLAARTSPFIRHCRFLTPAIHLCSLEPFRTQLALSRCFHRSGRLLDSPSK